MVPTRRGGGLGGGVRVFGGWPRSGPWNSLADAFGAFGATLGALQVWLRPSGKETPPRGCDLTALRLTSCFHRAHNRDTAEPDVLGSRSLATETSTRSFLQTHAQTVTIRALNKGNGANIIWAKTPGLDS